MNNDDQAIERLLTRYRPAGPPARLERRIRALAESPQRRAVVPGRFAAAALLVLGLALHLATERLNRRTIVAISGPTTAWSPEAEQAAELLNGKGAGRAYVRFALAVDRRKPAAAGVGLVPLGAMQ